MFTAGKSLIALYLAKAAPSSSYGAAGSLIILLLWTYYSSLIFLLGAEITQALYAGNAGNGKNGNALSS
jgi:membrane protein